MKCHPVVKGSGGRRTGEPRQQAAGLWCGPDATTQAVVELCFH